jgi:hypothetical protein
MQAGRQLREPDYGTQLIRWRGAEEALCSLVFADVDRYQRAMVLLGRVLSVLRRECRDPAELLAVADDPTRVLDRRGIEEALACQAEPQTVLHAACAQRAVELSRESG